jgi:flagellar assembly protein FliH
VTKIIGEAFTDRDVVISAMREVIRRTKERTELVVRISPADWAMLDGYQEQLTAGLNVGSVEIVADERVQLGGCLLETPAGSLDGRLEVQLERLRDALLNAVPASRDTDVAA